MASLFFVAAFALAPFAAAAQPLPKAAHEDEEEAQEHVIGLDEVNRLVTLGTIRRLSEVVAVVMQRAPGELIDADLRLRRGRYVYEIEILRGRRREDVYVDAATLEILGKD